MTFNGCWNYTHLVHYNKTYGLIIMIELYIHRTMASYDMCLK